MYRYNSQVVSDPPRNAYVGELALKRRDHRPEYDKKEPSGDRDQYIDIDDDEINDLLRPQENANVNNRYGDIAFSTDIHGLDADFPPVDSRDLL